MGGNDAARRNAGQDPWSKMGMAGRDVTKDTNLVRPSSATATEHQRQQRIVQELMPVREVDALTLGERYTSWGTDWLSRRGVVDRQRRQMAASTAFFVVV